VNFGKLISKYLGIFLLFLVLMSANISGLRPFAFGMLFCLIWSKQSVFVVSILYLVAGVIVFGTVEHLIVDAITVAVFGLAIFLHYRFKKPLNRVLIGCYAFLSQFGALYFASAEPISMWLAVVSLILGIICMYCYLNLGDSLQKLGIRRQYCIDEVICFGILIFGIGAGLWCLPYIEYYLFGVISLILLLSANILGPNISLTIALFLGLGISFASGNFLLLSHLIFVGIFANICYSNQRIWASLAVIFVNIISMLYFLGEFSLWRIIAVVVASGIYLILPKRKLQLIRQAVLTDREDFAVRSLVNQNRQSIYNRLYDLEQVFEDIGNVFFQMIKTEGSKTEKAETFSTQLRRKLCTNCPKRRDCIQSNQAISIILSNLTNIALARGKISLCDIPPVLTSVCPKPSILCNNINSFAKENQNYQQIVDSQNTNRRLLGEQMVGVADIIGALANEVNIGLCYNKELEENLKEGLLYAGILCSEVILYQNNNKICRANFIIKSRDETNPKFIAVISKIIGVKMEIERVLAEIKPTFSLVVCKNASNFDLIFGVAGIPKSINQKSGDTHSILKLGNDKVLLSLCDGMGSGDKAYDTSVLAINMIESFYRAGFDSNLILRSVNQMLTLTDRESFSAVDICVLDMQSGTCELIKVGAPPSFIKNGDNITVIQSYAMPLGILEEFEPKIYSCVLQDNDIIILATDGVIDSFGNLDNLRDCLARQKTQNPQEMANNILDIAKNNYKNYPQDDMTILVGRLFSKE